MNDKWVQLLEMLLKDHFTINGLSYFIAS